MRVSTFVCLIVGCCAPIFARAGSAQPVRGRASSVFTKLALHHCSKEAQEDDQQGELWRCPGFRHIPLIVRSTGGRFDIDAGEDNGLFETADAPSFLTGEIEWRLRGSHARSIIYRLRVATQSGHPRPLIAVETISYPNVWAGCLVAWVDGRLPNATAIARKLADRDHQTFRCGHDEPQDVPYRVRSSQKRIRSRLGLALVAMSGHQRRMSAIGG